MTPSSIDTPIWHRPARISSEHVTDDFDCGIEDLNQWLSRYALPNDRAGMARTFVTTGADKRTVVGYYALATGGISHASATPRVTKGVARHDIPVVILARLAVDRQFQGQRLGNALLRDALKRTLSIANEVGVRAFLIHAKSPEARRYYMSFAEFEPSPTDDLHLMLLLKDLRLLFRE